MRRHDRRWMMAKQIEEGWLGSLGYSTTRLAIHGRRCRNGLLFLAENKPVEVVARSHGKVYRELGHDINEATWAR